MADALHPDEPPQPITPGEVCALCADEPPYEGPPYRPSPKQTPFFTLAWAAKQGARVELPQAWLADKHGELMAAQMVQAQIATLHEHLLNSGLAVAQLRQNDDKVWELVRFQIEKHLKKRGGRETDREDAFGETAAKLCALLQRMPEPAAIESYPNGQAAAAAQGATLRRLYAFTAPIYAYVQRMAANELISVLRRHEAPDDFAWEDDPGGDEPQARLLVPKYLPYWQALTEGATLEEATTAEQAARIVPLRSALERLFNTVAELSPKRRQVLCLTLAARAACWQALDLAELEPPTALLAVALSSSTAAIQPMDQPLGSEDTPELAPGRAALAARCLGMLPDDTAIAARLGSNENTVRVTRRQALLVLAEEDQELYQLAVILIQGIGAGTGNAALNVGAAQA